MVCNALNDYSTGRLGMKKMYSRFRLCPTAVLGSPLQRIAPFLTEVDCVVILHFI